MGEQTRHLMAVIVNNRLYRDPESEVMTEEEFTAFVAGYHLPPHYHALHINSDRQWQEVLRISVIPHGCIKDELRDILPRLCHDCWSVPSIHDGRCQECLERESEKQWG